mgnify:CR=1 FL=1
MVHEKLHDFRNFLYLVWKHLRLPEPTPIQYDLAHFLATGSSRTIISAYRGCGKSWITSAYVLWRLLLNPQINVLVISASKNRADDFSTFTLRLIEEMPVLKHLIPSDKQNNKCMEVYDYMIDLSSTLGGVYSAEHGTGKRKRNDFKKCYGVEAVEMVKKLKNTIDPNNYLNRGNLISYN